MDKILTTEQAIKVSNQLRSEDKKVVLAGGCFDILHIGHLTFLRKAKMYGDSLFVLVESDGTIIKTKGSNRPVNTQKNRMEILAALDIVDFVIPLSSSMKNTDYDMLIANIKPAVIATTKDDPYISHKQRQAALTDAKVIEVTTPIENQSTTNLLKILEVN